MAERRQATSTRPLAERALHGTCRCERCADIRAARTDVLRRVHVVIREVARRFEIDPAALYGPAGGRLLSWRRQVAMCLARRCTGASFALLGSAFNRDHTTVMHGVRKVEDRLRSSAATREQMFLLLRCAELALASGP